MVLKFWLTAALLACINFCVFSQVQPKEDSSVVKLLFTDFEGTPRAGERVIFQGVNSQKRTEGVTNEQGKFSVLLPEGDIYQVKYINVTEEVDYDRMKIPKEPGAFTYSLHLQYEPPKTFTLDNVYFDSGKSSIRTESYPELDQLAELLSRKEDMVIEIAGHTDDVGEPESNLRLSQTRAEAVKSYLVKKGISPERIVAKGYGEKKPVAPNVTEEGRQQNRRTEVHILEE